MTEGILEGESYSFFDCLLQSFLILEGHGAEQNKEKVRQVTQSRPKVSFCSLFI